MLFNRTVIVIAHKISSVMLCDNVAVLKNGTLVDFGESKYVMENSIHFKEIFT